MEGEYTAYLSTLLGVVALRPAGVWHLCRRAALHRRCASCCGVALILAASAGSALRCPAQGGDDTVGVRLRDVARRRMPSLNACTARMLMHICVVTTRACSQRRHAGCVTGAPWSHDAAQVSTSVALRLWLFALARAHGCAVES